MTDIVERLRFCVALHRRVGQPENAKLFGEAADEILEGRMTCRIKIKNAGGPYPRSCPECKFGPCKYGETEVVQPMKQHELFRAGRAAQLELDAWRLFGALDLEQKEEVVKDMQQRVWSQQYGEDRDDG